MAALAATRPVGVYNHPQLVTSPASAALALDNAKKMTCAILARGLQQQFHGDARAFVSGFRIVGMLARTLRHGGGMHSLDIGIEIEKTALSAAERWLERLDPGEGELPRILARIIAEWDDPKPFDPRPYTLADRYLIREMMRAHQPVAFGHAHGAR